MWQGKSSDLIPLGDGLNFSTPLDQISGTVVPNPLFFVRNNYQPPEGLTPDAWCLRIEGRVRQPLEIRLEDLKALPSTTEEVWLECAGNGRSHFDPPAEGNQWNDYAVSNAEFTGVPLRTFLERAGVESDAVEVVAYGGESSEFARGLPLDVALLPEVILAYAMNGAPIPMPNGGPVRMVVPRWAGIASVKWPARLEVVNTPFTGYYNRQRYVVIDADGNEVRSVRELPVKSVIAWPGEAATLDRTQHTVFGFAWSGFGDIAQVEVSTDGEHTWRAARLVHGSGPLAWTRWEIEWTPESAGAMRIAARATDSSGNVQPAQAAWNKFGYEMNAVAVREVVVSA
jgi:DMSO/TMAO reductase YedYZ molybdopterin-dependent catalytic subunit